jgi:uncharacterized protein
MAHQSASHAAGRERPVNYQPVVISLPIADRPRSYDFYRRALGLKAVGEPADDGVPEPLQFVVNAGVRVLLAPRAGFGRTIGDGQVAPPGHHECLLVIGAATEADTDALVERAVAEGAELVTPPGPQPWGLERSPNWVAAGSASTSSLRWTSRKM